MSEKPKIVKNVVQTRGKGKSKAGGDSDTNKTNSQSDKNYDTDEPLAVAVANRIPDRDYQSDVPVGGPQVAREPVTIAALSQGAGRRQPASVARSLEPVLAAAQAQERAEQGNPGTSDVESVRSMQRAESRASQRETVKKRRTRQAVVADRPRAPPEGVTEDDTQSEAVGDAAAAGPEKKNKSTGGKRPRIQPLQSADEYYTDMDRGSMLSYGSGSTRRSQVSATASEIENFRRDIAELRRQVREVKRAMPENSEQQIREDHRLAEIMQAEFLTAAETDGGEPQDAAQNHQRPKRPPVQRRERRNEHSKPNQDENDVQRQPTAGNAAAGAGAPGGGGDDDDDGGDSDRDWYRHHRNRHVRDAARRRAARMSDNQDSIHPPSRTSRRGSVQALNQPPQVQPSGYIYPGFDAGKIAADAVAAASKAWQALAPTRMHIEQVNLPKFDGKEFLLFQKQFDAVAQEQQWGPDTCARKLLECLQGDTRRHVEVTMSYDEMLEALGQYYAGSRPSIEAKNILRHFNKNKDESIEEFASRIQACADGARLTQFDKLKYMQEAFMNGFRNDTKMQRYIEKRTSQHENVPIVKLLKAAQDYLHDKQGSTQSGQGTKAKLGSHKAKGKKQGSDDASEAQPQLKVMKGGRKGTTHTRGSRCGARGRRGAGEGAKEQRREEQAEQPTLAQTL